MATTQILSAPINSRLNVLGVPNSVWVGSKWLLVFPRVPVTRGTHLRFFAVLPLNDRRRAAHSFFKIGRLFSLFSCLSFARPRLLILLLLMSSNIHPNSGPIFQCELISVCAGNVTRRGKSVQCCTWSSWVHLRCLLLSLSKFRTLGSFHSWSCQPYCVPTRNTVTSSSDSTAQSCPPLPMLDSRPTLVFKPLIPLLLILYFLPLPPHHCPLLLAVLLRLRLPFPPRLPQGSSMECWRSLNRER